MHSKKKVYIAADTSHEKGSIALFDDKQIIFSGVIEKKLEHALKLPKLFAEAQKIVDNEGLSLSGCFAGLGPGSFVGIRVALAFLQGYALARSLPLQGFCSHKAILQSINKNNGLVYLLMKANGDLYYQSSFLDNIEIAEKKTIKLDDFFQEKKDNFTLITDDEKITYNKKILINGPNSKGLFNECLNKINHIENNNFPAIAQYVSKPNVRASYIQPAV